MITIFVVIFKFIENFVNLRKTYRYEKLYNRYCNLFTKESGEKTEQEDIFNDEEINLEKKLHEYRTQISAIFKKAELKDIYVTIAVPTGYGHGVHQQYSIFENLTSIKILGDVNIPITIKKYFRTTIGFFKVKMWEALNPLYWIKKVIFLPQELIRYIGFPKELKTVGIVVRILNIIYWLIIIFLAILHLKLTLIVSRT